MLNIVKIHTPLLHFIVFRTTFATSTTNGIQKWPTANKAIK